MLRLVLFALLGCVSFQLALAAVSRPIPVAAKRAVMIFSGAGTVQVGSQSASLSPGAQIRDVNNRILLPGAVSGEFVVRVLIDNNGQVHRVWILTPEEISKPDPKQ